jgi:hypothetical protein
LSDEALHETVIDVVVEPVRANDPGAVGGDASAQAAVAAETEIRSERSPCGPKASTPSSYVVPHASPSAT